MQYVYRAALAAAVLEANSLLYAQSSDENRNSPGYHLDILAAVDMTGEWDKEKNTGIIKEGRDPETYADRQIAEYWSPRSTATSNRAYIRSAELGFMAAVDHLAEGTFMLAAHDEGGEVYYDIHEASLFFPVTPVPGMTFKLGRFFLDAGRLNTIHQHDWPFTRTPVVHKELLASEGVGDFGGEIQYLFPLPFFLEAGAGVFNGRTFGHAHGDGPKKANPLFNGRLKSFFSPYQDWGIQTGATYIRLQPDSGKNTVMHQSGLDFTVKWEKGNQSSFQWTTEVWYRETQTKEPEWYSYNSVPVPVSTQVGAYSFMEYKFHKQWIAGIRYDFFKMPTMTAEAGFRQTPGITLAETADELKKNGNQVLPEDPFLIEYMKKVYVKQGWTESMTVKNLIQEAAVMLTFRPSEFSYFRGTVTRRTEQLYRNTDHILNLQAVFIIGKHPAHIY